MGTKNRSRSGKSIKDRCREIGISVKTYYSRKHLGWSKEKALTTPPGEKPDRKIKGPDGKVYASETEMCRAYGADPKLYAARIAYGCPMEKALTMEKQEQGFPKKPQKGPDGKMYASKTDMCKAYGVSWNVYKERRRRGWSMEDALTKPLAKQGRRAKPQVGPDGKQYDSTRAMCEAYGIKYSVFEARLSRGMTRDEALTYKRKKKT